MHVLNISGFSIILGQLKHKVFYFFFVCCTISLIKDLISLFALMFLQLQIECRQIMSTNSISLFFFLMKTLILTFKKVWIFMYITNLINSPVVDISSENESHHFVHNMHEHGDMHCMVCLRHLAWLMIISHLFESQILDTLLNKTCSLAALARVLTSETMIAMMRLIMIREPNTTRPIRRVMVNTRVRESSLLESWIITLCSHF